MNEYGLENKTEPFEAGMKLIRIENGVTIDCSGDLHLNVGLFEDDSTNGAIIGNEIGGQGEATCTEYNPMLFIGIAELLVILAAGQREKTS